MPGRKLVQGKVMADAKAWGVCVGLSNEFFCKQRNHGSLKIGNPPPHKYKERVIQNDQTAFIQEIQNW